MRPVRLLLLAGGLLAAGSLSGCRPKDDIRAYEGPQPEALAPRPDRRPGEPKRLIGALFYKEDSTWVFKVDGPEKGLGAQKEAIETFLRSVRFPADKDGPIWQLPGNWKEKAAMAPRIATLVLPDNLELALTRFPKQDLLANVKRWRNQVGLAPVEEAELEKSAKREVIDGVTAYFVDVVGPAKAAGGDQVVRVPPAEEPKPLITYDLPGIWKKEPPGQFSLYAFSYNQGAKSARLTITPLAGQAGGLVGNIDRWRKELKLPEASGEQIQKEAAKIEIDGRPAYFVDLANPKMPEHRIVGALLFQEQGSWFFKMFGAADLIESQKPAFEAFLRSIRFQDAKGK